MSDFDASSLAIPSALRRESAPTGFFRADVLRSGELLPWLIETIRLSATASEETRDEVAAALSLWAHSWAGAAASPSEFAWLERLVALAAALVRAGGADTPPPAACADWPEAPAYTRLLRAEAGLAAEPSRFVHAPVVFIPGREDIGTPSVALLELRLVPGPDEPSLPHPADRWRRDRLGSAEQAGPAEPDFVAEIADTVALARAHWRSQNHAPALGVVFWRLVDPHYPSRPHDANGVLRGPSAGGAALRAALHLLGPDKTALAPRVFVLARLARGAEARPDRELMPVGGTREKIVALAASLDGDDSEARHRCLLVLPELLPPAKLPPEVDVSEIHPGPVATVAALRRVGPPPVGTRLRLGETPRQVEKLRADSHKHRRLAAAVLFGVVVLAVAYVVHDQRQKADLVERQRLAQVEAARREAEALERAAAQDARLDRLAADLGLFRQIVDEQARELVINKAALDALNIQIEEQLRRALAAVARQRGETFEHLQTLVAGYLAAVERDPRAELEDRARLEFSRGNFKAAQDLFREWADLAELARLETERARQAARLVAEELERRYHADLRRERSGRLGETRAAQAARDYQAAVAALDKALAITPKAEYPKEWAEQQFLLGNAHSLWASTSTEIQIAERRNRAVSAYRAALEVFTRKALPQAWALTQNNLALALRAQAATSEGPARATLLADAISTYRAALEVRTREALPQAWAQTQDNIASALRAQAAASEGQARASLLADAVSAYRAALEVRTREALPQEWARTQNNLANALSDQAAASEGPARATLLADAVSSFRAALKVLTHEALPQDWALTQNNLASALYLQAAASEGPARATLLSDAVSAFRASLEVRTRETLPQDWALTQNSLASALYLQAAASEGPARAAFLADAASAYCAALKVRTREALPQGWAQTQNNLGIALRAQAAASEGQARASLLADAVSAFRAALEVRTREALPQDWASTQSNLAGALRDQAAASEGSARVTLLADAVSTYRAALEVFTREALPQYWAMTQNNLANALRDQAVASEGPARATLLADAVSACRAALNVRTREALPQDWAQTQNNLANALSTQAAASEGSARVTLLADAVSAYRAALEVHTREALPQDWAQTQNNLGTALRAQAASSEGPASATLLADAVSAYRASLKVRTREALPQDWAQTQNNLGIALRAQAAASESQARATLLADAVSAFRAALEVRNREALPQDWASTQSNLAGALRDQAAASEGPDRAKLLTEVKSALDSAALVFTAEGLPSWHKTYITTRAKIDAELARLQVSEPLK